MKTILIVDGLLFTRELLSSAMRRAGYDVDTAQDGLEALELIKRRAPALVIAEASLPNMDGLTMLRVMRSTPDFKAIPVFILSGVNDRQHLTQALQIGVQEYILKSQFTFETMRARIEKYVNTEKISVMTQDSSDASSGEPTAAAGEERIGVVAIEGEIEADFVVGPGTH